MLVFQLQMQKMQKSIVINLRLTHVSKVLPLNQTICQGPTVSPSSQTGTSSFFNPPISSTSITEACKMNGRLNFDGHLQRIALIP